MSVFGSSGGSQSITLAGVSSPQVDNIPLTTAATEYSITLPNGTQKYLIKLRDATVDMQLSFVTAGDYVTIPRGCFFSEDGISVLSLTLYVQASSANQIVEIVSWS